MKTKNTRVRVEDIKYGRIIYIAHPVYGIEKYIIKSKPYMEKGVYSGNIGLFAKAGKVYSDWVFESSISLRDSGIMKGEGYNDRRSFFKLKHAEEWVRKWSSDKGFIERHTKHENNMKMFKTIDNYAGQVIWPEPTPFLFEDLY